MAENSIKRRYIRVLEPWGGGHNPWDTGLGNRLLHFDTIYQLYRQNNYNYFLELEYRYWRELEWIELPGTRVFQVGSRNEELQKLISKFDYNLKDQTITPLAPLGDDIMREFIHKGKFKSSEPRYYTCFDWDFVGEMYLKTEKENKYSGLSRIIVKNKTLFNKLRGMGSYCVGIHMRRGAGVFKSPSDNKELPSSVRSNPWQQSVHNSTIYKYYKNNVYIKLIEEILQQNPKQKFYISCDLQTGEYGFLKEKFGDNIKSREDIIKQLPEDIITGIDFEDEYDERKIALESVIDMFTLSYCDFLIAAPHSSWIDSIVKMRYVPRSIINEPRDHILEAYATAMSRSRGLL